MTNYPVVPVAGPEPRAIDFQSAQLIWILLALLEGALALQLVLTVAADGAATPWSALIDSFTGFFLVPFIGLAAAVAGGGAALAVAIVLAMLVYAVLGAALQRVAWTVFYRPYAAAPPAMPATILNQRKPLKS